MNEPATINKVAPPTEEELTALHAFMEDRLVEMRDARMFMMNANGLVIREFDGAPSDIIRIGTRMAVDMIVNKFLELRGLS